jgi:hypothetical protein
VIHEWFVVHFAGQRNLGIVRLEDFLRRTQLGTRAYPNAGSFEVPIAVSSLLPQAVAEARRYMTSRRKEFQDRLQLRLQAEVQSLVILQGRQLCFLESEYPDNETLVGARRNKKQERRRHIDAVFADYKRWVEDTLTTEDSPFLRVAAVFMG